MTTLAQVGVEVNTILGSYHEQLKARHITKAQYHARCTAILNMMLVASGVRPACLVSYMPHPELTQLTAPTTAFYEHVWSKLAEPYVFIPKKTAFFYLKDAIPKLKKINGVAPLLTITDVGNILGYPTPWSKLECKESAYIITSFVCRGLGRNIDLYSFNARPDSGWDLSMLDVYGIKMAKLMQQAFKNMGCNVCIDITYHKRLG